MSIDHLFWTSVVHFEKKTIGSLCVQAEKCSRCRGDQCCCTRKMVIPSKRSSSLFLFARRRPAPSSISVFESSSMSRLRSLISWETMSLVDPSAAVPVESSVLQSPLQAVGDPTRRPISVCTGSPCLRALDEIVAVKVVDATKFRSIAEIELIQDEIRALSSVKHENIVNLREVLFEDHVFYFVMDFASGGSLVLPSTLSFHSHKTPLPTGTTRAIQRPVSAARGRGQRNLSPNRCSCLLLSSKVMPVCHPWLHPYREMRQCRRVIHRDLKPENILLDAHGRVQVADFGLSVIAAPFGSLSNIRGTPEFLAPELISSSEFDGAIADIWSMGVVLHELLTGRTPFKGTSTASLFRAIQT